MFSGPLDTGTRSLQLRPRMHAARCEDAHNWDKSVFLGSYLRKVSVESRATSPHKGFPRQIVSPPFRDPSSLPKRQLSRAQLSCQVFPILFFVRSMGQRKP